MSVGEEREPLRILGQLVHVDDMARLRSWWNRPQARRRFRRVSMVSRNNNSDAEKDDAIDASHHGLKTSATPSRRWTSHGDRRDREDGEHADDGDRSRDTRRPVRT